MKTEVDHCLIEDMFWYVTQSRTMLYGCIWWYLRYLKWLKRVYKVLGYSSEYFDNKGDYTSNIYS